MAPVRHHPAHLGAGAAILGCIFLSWLVLLAGIAACQRQMLDKTALEFEWWIICFEFLLVCLAATHLSGYHRSHAGLVALKAVNTVLCMVYANIWNKIYRQGGTSEYYTALYPSSTDASSVSGVTHKRIDCALAGFVLLSIFNTLLLAVLGTAPTTRYHDNVASTRGTQMATTTYPATTTTYPATTTTYPTSAATPVQGGEPGAGTTVV
ncbi:TPA: hypothetical protein ACH3X2_012795 [Trebouxia sp. C0005]